jgi:uncharacterized protein YgiM (DUF1202 family)
MKVESRRSGASWMSIPLQNVESGKMLKVESRRSVASWMSIDGLYIGVVCAVKAKRISERKSNARINKLNKFGDVLTANLHRNIVLTDETTSLPTKLRRKYEKCTYIEIGIFQYPKTYELWRRRTRRQRMRC